MKRNKIRRAMGIYLAALLVMGHVYVEYAQSESETKANIKFVPNTEEITPVDPDDPSEPDTGLPAVTGPLVILHVTDFLFGTETVTAGKQVIDIKTVKPNVQIADLRGNSKGWMLDVSLSSFQNELGETTLKGAKISIKDGRLASETSMTYKPTVHTNRELTTDGSPVRIMTAGENQGQGIWVNRFYPEYTTEGAFVVLDIPAGMTAPGTHSAIMTWALLDTP